jgi:ribulose-5-phosphate 4-epimerase/fuculose-1-phosphate aldolase
VADTLTEAQILDLRQQLVDCCHILAKTGCVREITGNVSARLPGTNEMLLRCRRPNDPGVEFTILEDIRRLNIEGRGWEVIDGYELPGEFAIHSEIYKARPEVNAVVHGHPRASLICGIINLPFQPLIGAYDPGMLSVALGGVPVFPRAVLVRTPELGRQLVETMGESKICLMRGHGVTTVGASVPEATMRAVKLEAMAELSLQVHATGLPPILLSEQDIVETMPSWTPREETFLQWTWEFYKQKLREVRVG